MALATRPKPTVTHKKRRAQHHRQSKHYLKPYWPYLPMLAIIGLGFWVNSVWAHSGVLGAQADFSASSLLSSTNAQRAADKEAALTLDPQLAAAAQAKANDMVSGNYWAHNSPDGRSPWSFIAAAGYQYQSAGENLAYGFGNAGDTVTGWMNSPEHRANVLDAGYRNVGFGVAQSPNYQGHGPETIVVAEYGQPVAAAANISFNVANTSQNMPAQVRGANTEIATQHVSRIQILTGGQIAWLSLAVAASAGAAFAVFLMRHGWRLHRALSRGEAFIVHHPWVDIFVTVVFTAGFVLTRTSGLIR